MSRTEQKGGTRRTRIGASEASTQIIAGLGAFLVVTGGLLLYGLWQFWPPAASTAPTGAAAATNLKFHFLAWDFTFSREKDFLVIVALAGAVGTVLHGLRSLARYVGERLMYRSWILFYITLPVIGAILATIVYFVLRAGLISGGGAANTDPFGFAAVAALVGLFSAQAAEKLKSVFETLFARPESGSDSIEKVEEAPTITALSPGSGAEGDEIAIEGTGLQEASAVTFGGTAATEFSFDDEADQLLAVVPPGAATGEVKVITPQGTAISPEPFTIESP